MRVLKMAYGSEYLPPDITKCEKCGLTYWRTAHTEEDCRKMLASKCPKCGLLGGKLNEISQVGYFFECKTCGVVE